MYEVLWFFLGKVIFFIFFVWGYGAYFFFLSSGLAWFWFGLVWFGLMPELLLLWAVVILSCFGFLIGGH